MEIKEIAIKRLRAYANNAKKHPQEQIQKIMMSIERYGFRVPVVADRDLVVIAGHGRLLAAERLGLKKVPVVIADDLTPAQSRAFRIADNRVAESEWDSDKLLAEVQDLQGEDGFDLELTGFSLDEIDELRGAEAGNRERRFSTIFVDFRCREMGVKHNYT